MVKRSFVYRNPCTSIGEVVDISLYAEDRLEPVDDIAKHPAIFNYDVDGFLASDHNWKQLPEVARIGNSMLSHHGRFCLLEGRNVITEEQFNNCERSPTPEIVEAARILLTGLNSCRAEYDDDSKSGSLLAPLKPEFVLDFTKEIIRIHSETIGSEASVGEGDPNQRQKKMVVYLCTVGMIFRQTAGSSDFNVIQSLHMKLWDIVKAMWTWSGGNYQLVSLQDESMLPSLDELSRPSDYGDWCHEYSLHYGLLRQYCVDNNYQFAITPQLLVDFDDDVYSFKTILKQAPAFVRNYGMPPLLPYVTSIGNVAAAKGIEALLQTVTPEGNYRQKFTAEAIARNGVVDHWIVYIIRDPQYQDWMWAEALLGVGRMDLFLA